jgi:hypothetical protein
LRKCPSPWEAGHSAAIERLVALGYRVYPVHPRSSKSYRTRKLPGGTKTDRADCWALLMRYVWKEKAGAP